MKNQEKRYLYITYLALAVMFLLCCLVLLVGRATNIQTHMIHDLIEIYEDKENEVLAISKSEETDKAALLGQYQMALSDASITTNYPYCASGILQHRDGEVMLKSQNLILCTFRDQEGNILTVPMVFGDDNNADVGEVLFRNSISVYAADPGIHNTFRGYWEEGLFYIDYFFNDYVGYYSEYSLCDGEYVEYEVGRGYPYRWVDVKVCAKSYGEDEVSSNNYRFGKFVDGWEKTDELTEKLIAMDAVSEHGSSLSVKKKSLFSTLLVGTKDFSDIQEVFDGGKSLKLVYGMEFSPMGLAAKELMQNGSFIFMLLIFVFGGVVLTTLFSQNVSRQMQGYKDEIYRQQQALTYAQDAEKSRREMTSAIAHELKTPIAVLSSYSEALQENIDAEKQAHYLGVIRDETGKMDRMVLELLDYSRLEAGKYQLRRENFDLSELVREILVPLEGQIEEKHLSVEWQIGEVLVNADRYRFGQVVENYLTNAIRHTPEGGRIILRIGMNKVTFSVENQGNRLAQEELKKVWEAFWQGDQSRSQRGTGLGLSIVKTIMQLHGGSCRAENTGFGVRFVANLQEEKATVVLRFMPQEDEIELDYPIAQEYTTVKQMFSQLRLLEGKHLRREMKAGNIRCGSQTVISGKARLSPGNVVLWREFRITVTLDNDHKRRAIIANQFQPTGRLSNFGSYVGSNSGMKY